MSILKVDELQSRTSGNRITLPDVNNYPPYRNLIINGDMSIAQRGTTAVASSDNILGATDRFRHQNDSGGATSVTKDTDTPTAQGFSNSMKVDVTTADASLSSSDMYRIQYRIEGQMLQQIKKGTANAESLTLSFWVKSPKTGTHIVNIFDNDNTRSIAKSYTVSSADTWEKKTITFEGDTTGTLDNDNLNSLAIYWYLCAGSNFTSGTLATSWESSTNVNLAVGQVNVMDSASNNFYLTGVQLEVGDSATPFEHLPYDVNLQRCQRYFCKFDFPQTIPFFSSHRQSANTVRTAIETPVPMRTTPTINGTGQPTIIYQSSGAADVTDSSGTSLTVIGASVDLNRFVVSNPNVTGVSGMVNAFAFSGDLECSAEL